MHKVEKQVKAVKSLYSHEIRKDVSLGDLQSLKLEDAWPFIREEIEKEIGIGRKDMVCVPYITEANLYSVSSVLLKPEDETSKTLVGPIGKLSQVIDREKTNPEYLEWLDSTDFVDKRYRFPHESVKITLQDEELKNKVRVILLNIQRHSFPKGKSPINNVFISQEKETKGLKSIYMITNILVAKTVEFRVNKGTSSRIFHIGDPTPLVFGFDKFDINEDGQIISESAATIPTKDVSWNKIIPHDHLCHSTIEHFAVTT